MASPKSVAAALQARPPALPRPDTDEVTTASIEDAIFDLLAKRREGATVCPSEVARALATDEGSWRGLMPRIRQVAQGLADADRLAVTRGGVPVDATRPGGPIRLGRRGKPVA